MSTRRWWLAALAIALFALALRGVWLTADPPTTDQAGIFWHDEGAWTHNARNKVLWGTWRADGWNPLFIAPVFTALEYAAFEVAGVGTWQARVVPVASGLLAIVALMLGLHVTTGRRAALIGGLLLTTSFTFVMWNRAALMESTMTAFMTMSWAAYAMSAQRRWLGVAAGLFAVAAFFTKAAAAFFVAALLAELLLRLIQPTNPPTHQPTTPPTHQPTNPPAHQPTSPWWPFVGLAVGAVAVFALFIWPHWTEFQFYNWEMTVTRKPTYGIKDFIQRATWLPLVHGVFSRMWLVMVLAAVGALAVIRRWPEASPAARLAVLWLAIGLLELVVHDAGNERRYVMFVPALIALALSSEVSFPAPSRKTHLRAQLLVAAAIVPLTYLVAGSLLRLVWLDDVLAGEFSRTVRVSAAMAGAAGVAAWWFRDRLSDFLAAWRPSAAVLTVAIVLTVGTDLTLFGRWAANRTYFNVEASRLIGDVLPPGTLVHGKLANGLAFENRIRPIFVGRGFGNYADRLSRDDARYILSYTEADGKPDAGYEGDVILDVLAQYPQRQIVLEFDVQETPGRDRAALIDKFPDGPDPRARDK
jgi:hypothetical protein